MGNFAGQCSRRFTHMWQTWRTCLALVLSLWCAGTGSARAEEGSTRILSEPTDYTDVIDAADADDPFDFDVHLGFERTSESGSLQRETTGSDTTTGLRHVADTSHVVNQLVLGLDAGLYQDLMVYARLPLVLSDTRTLSNGSSEAPGPGSSGTLFTVPFSAPTRSGVPAIDVGVAWGITNQFRRPTLPTWVVAIESRVGVGSDLKPCKAGSGCDAGISRGTARLKLSSRWSYRFRFFEPYLGLSYAYEWATSARDHFAPGGDLAGYVDTTPPTEAEGTLGVSIVPWEERGRFQRFAIDLRGSALLLSGGRDYTALFDALGSSSSPFLTEKNSDHLVANSPGRKVPFTGLTNADAHARVGLETALVMQAAQYVRFRLGFGLAFVSPYLLTNTVRCNADSHAANGDPRAGDCYPNLWNPQYRPVIDLPGQRFRLVDDVVFDLFATAIGQF